MKNKPQTQAERFDELVLTHRDLPDCANCRSEADICAGCFADSIRMDSPDMMVKASAPIYPQEVV